MHRHHRQHQKIKSLQNTTKNRTPRFQRLQQHRVAKHRHDQLAIIVVYIIITTVQAKIIIVKIIRGVLVKVVGIRVTAQIVIIVVAMVLEASVKPQQLNDPAR